MTDKPTAPAGAMLAALESIQVSVKEKEKQVPIKFNFTFEFTRVSEHECRIKAYFGTKSRPWELKGCDLMKEIDSIEQAVMTVIDPVVAVYEKAKARNVEIKLEMLESTCQESHPPIYEETWKIDVGEWTKTATSYNPAPSLIEEAGKSAPLLQ